MDPGLRRDDDHASACAQFDYTRFRGNDEEKARELNGRNRIIVSEAGTQGRALNRQLIIKVPPLQIMTLNQFELPRAPPLLEPLFAQYGSFHGVMNLG